MRALSLLSAAALLPLTGCTTAAPVIHIAPAHAGSLACAETRADRLSYTIYGHVNGHAAGETGFTAERRAGEGYAGGSVSREILLVDLYPAESPTLRVSATAAETVASPATGRQRHLPREASPATIRDAAEIVEACAR